MASPDVSEAVKKDSVVSLEGRQRQAGEADGTRSTSIWANEMIKEAGYANFRQLVRAQGGPDFEQVMAELFNGLLPLYKELHGYKYPASIFPPTGHIPGHILGHMWARRWDDLEPFTKPFPMSRRLTSPKQMFEASQDFFASLGLGNMTDTFWGESVLGEAAGSDFRIKQCTEITGHYLAVTHHEMGHIQYFQQYEKQPGGFRDGANPGFHEAIGDTIELHDPGASEKTRPAESDSESDEFYLNSLFLMALKKAAYLPFGYLIDNYRYKLFKGEVPKNQWNSEWVNQRCQLMGVSSPVLRSEEDFDAGAIYHVVANVEYMRRVQFQFHQSLCQAQVLRRIFTNAASTATLRRRKAQSGTSLHWEEALFKISGTRQISLLDYFAPLQAYIAAKNKENA
uniref:Angiotensin-converting enzyme n=1 Tax=Macrostomum lignano TaxID=282301 RepID=A0A1I8F786_9PLAT